MSIWLAVSEDPKHLPKKLTVLDAVEARSEEEAFYKFMHLCVYPKYVLELNDRAWDYCLAWIDSQEQDG